VTGCCERLTGGSIGSVERALLSAKSGDRSDFLPVEVGYPADARPGGPSPERRFASGVVSVNRSEETIFEHRVALIGGEELEAEIRIACGHGSIKRAEQLPFG
jgi:hypothetical protein